MKKFFIAFVLLFFISLPGFSQVFTPEKTFDFDFLTDPGTTSETVDDLEGDQFQSFKLKNLGGRTSIDNSGGFLYLIFINQEKTYKIKKIYSVIKLFSKSKKLLFSKNYVFDYNKIGGIPINRGFKDKINLKKLYPKNYFEIKMKILSYETFK